MTCTRSTEDIQALIDGTLGPIRAAELEQHLDRCEQCRALARDLRRIRDLADTLGDPEPPDHVWLQIAGRLRQEGRVHDQPAGDADGTPAVRVARDRRRARARRRRIARAADAAIRAIVAPERHDRRGQGNAAAAAAVQSGVEDLMKAEELLQSGVAKLEQGIGSDGQASAESKLPRRSRRT